jgi:D-serine deaminase-like pyridoxal phosphate-dependent protein
MIEAAPPFPRAVLPTPALIVDLPALERNVAAMAAWAAASGIALRPHAKTHKSADIARRQLAAGAAGICCAKLGEAEALAAAGVRDILITSPVVPAQALARLAGLAPRLDRLAVVADHPDNVDAISAALANVGASLDVVVDVDTGAHRTGVTSPEAAVALAACIAAHPNLRFRGVQFYCGTLQHVASAAERSAALAASAENLRAVLAALTASGLPAEIVTGGGTGSFAIDADIGLLTELQCGSYVFMDREYRDCEAVGPAFEAALFIDTRVVSANTPGRVTVDAGLKAMATEAGPPVVASGAHPDSAYRFMGDEHGMLLRPAGAADPALDALIALVPPHCDPTVNLYDRYAVCSGDTVVAWWPVTARGRSS